MRYLDISRFFFIFADEIITYKNMNKTNVNGIVDCINKFYERSEDLGKIIANHLRENNLKSMPCYSLGGCNGWCEKVINSLVFLRVGFMNENAFKHHGNKNKNVLCVLGYNLGRDVNVFMTGYHNLNPLRIVEEFDKLPMSMQIEIFRSCFGGFEYANNYRHWFTELTEKTENFNRLEPPFDKCYMADWDNSCHELKFSGEWDEEGRAIFVSTSNAERKPRFPEKGLFRIASGSMERWGFDYAFSFDKESLRKICRGGFTKDYTEEK